MFNKIINIVKNMKLIKDQESAYEMYKEDFMTLPYEKKFKNCTLSNAIGCLHYMNIHNINKRDFVYIMKPSTMIKKGKKRKFSNIKRGSAIQAILKECRTNEPVFIVSFNNPKEACNLSVRYKEKYKNKEFNWDLFVELLREI